MCSPVFPERPLSSVARLSSVRSLPTPATLAALGPILCLHRDGDGLLAGAQRATGCRYCAHVDSDGLHECLRFHDANGEECWRLHALPESDFLGWERLGSILPACDCHVAEVGLVERLWRDLAETLTGRRLLASVVRVHAFVTTVASERQARLHLALSRPDLSAFGTERAWRIARAERAILQEAHPSSSRQVGAPSTMDRRTVTSPGDCAGGWAPSPH